MFSRRGLFAQYREITTDGLPAAKRFAFLRDAALRRLDLYEPAQGGAPSPGSLFGRVEPPDAREGVREGCSAAGGAVPLAAVYRGRDPGAPPIGIVGGRPGFP